MARKAEPGISYYPVKVNHTQNSKIRLLFNEFGADGYWIWKCLLDRIYEDKGYYMDVKNSEELELFATDVCKKKVAVVEEVITGCVRRGLFDKTVFDMFGIITNDRIQSNYLEATSERRRKGTVIELKGEFLVIKEDENWKNINVTRKKEINPRKNKDDPRQNPQSKEEYSKEKESKKTAGAEDCFKNPFSNFFLKEWDLWKQFLKEEFKFSYNSNLSEQAAINHLVDLSEGNEETAKKIIHQSFARKWKGLFELSKEQKNGKSGTGVGSDTKSVLNAFDQHYGKT